jgi:transposase
LRKVLKAILYVLRSGCRWRLLPTSFPPFDGLRLFSSGLATRHLYADLGSVADGRARAGRLGSLADAAYNAILTICAAAQSKLRAESVKRPRNGEGFRLLSSRWVIERTFASLGLNRHLAKDIKRKV